MVGMAERHNFHPLNSRWIWIRMVPNTSQANSWTFLNFLDVYLRLQVPLRIASSLFAECMVHHSHTGFFFRVASLVVLSAMVWSIGIPHKRACNGHAEVCSQSYGNITYVGGVHYNNIIWSEAELNPQPMIHSLIAKILSLVKFPSLFRTKYPYSLGYFSGTRPRS
jgi:hypothetical protein